MPKYVAYPTVYISCSVCRYCILHCPQLVYTLSRALRSVTTLEPVGLRHATGDILVTPVSAVTRMKLHVGNIWLWSSWRCLLVIKCNSMLACDQSGDVCSWSNATPYLRVIKLEMFPRDQMQLHVGLWPRWRCLIVIKCNPMLARGHAGDVCSWSNSSMFACDQAGDVCSWSNATPCLRVIKLDTFALDQKKIHVCAWSSRKCLLQM